MAAAGIVPLVMLAMSAVAAGTSIYEGMNQPKAPSPTTQATSTDTTEAAAYASAQAMAKRQGAAGTILTGSQGVIGTPNTARQTLGA
jgi:hypothetical protein